MGQHAVKAPVHAHQGEIGARAALPHALIAGGRLLGQHQAAAGQIGRGLRVVKRGIARGHGGHNGDSGLGQLGHYQGCHANHQYQTHRHGQRAGHGLSFLLLRLRRVAGGLHAGAV